MPEFKKGGGWSGKFLSKSPYKKETRWEGPKDAKAKSSERSKHKDKTVSIPKYRQDYLDIGKKQLAQAHPTPKIAEPKTKDLKRKAFKTMKTLSKKASHLKATIAKDPSIDEELGLNKIKTTKATKKKDWEPAFEGADHSQEELDKMTKEEKEAYYD